MSDKMTPTNERVELIAALNNDPAWGWRTQRTALSIIKELTAAHEALKAENEELQQKLALLEQLMNTQVTITDRPLKGSAQ